MQVNWAPWGQFYDLQKVKDSQVATSRRILLPGPYGAEWYLGERVSIQSLSTDAFFVPKAPPQSMIVPEILSIVTEHWATDGKPALEFVESTDQEMYNEFRRYCFSSSPSIQVLSSTFMLQMLSSTLITLPVSVIMNKEYIY